ncbi:MAG: leucine-rich repeat protein, partial [Clostridia bacterium]|nr:leucine-rich repeat protein [Clostridia bacterium]
MSNVHYYVGTFAEAVENNYTVEYIIQGESWDDSSKATAKERVEVKPGKSYLFRYAQSGNVAAGPSVNVFVKGIVTDESLKGTVSTSYDRTARNFVSGKWVFSHGTIFVDAGNRFATYWSANIADAAKIAWLYEFTSDEVFELSELYSLEISHMGFANSKLFNTSTYTGYARIHVAGGDKAYYDVPTVFEHNQGYTVDVASIWADEVAADKNFQPKGYVTAIELHYFAPDKLEGIEVVKTADYPVLKLAGWKFVANGDPANRSESFITLKKQIDNPNLKFIPSTPLRKGTAYGFYADATYAVAEYDVETETVVGEWQYFSGVTSYDLPAGDYIVRTAMDATDRYLNAEPWFITVPHSDGELDRIELSLPHKTEYLIRSSLKLDGLRAIAVFEDGIAADVTDFITVDTTGIDKLGTNTVTVSWRDKSATFDVTGVMPHGSSYGFSWSISEDGVLTISGEGKLPTGITPPWYNYFDLIKSIVIEKGVTDIGEGLFAYCDVDSITLPDGVNNISYKALSTKSYDFKLNIPASVTNIGDINGETKMLFSYIMYPEIHVDKDNEHYASDERGTLFLKDMSKMLSYPSYATNKEYAIPEGVVSLHISNLYYGAFGAFNTHLEKIIIPASMTVPLDARTGDVINPFLGCSKLSEIEVAKNSRYLSVDEYGVLYNKDKTILISCPRDIVLSEFTIPESVVEIVNDAFYGCDNLTVKNSDGTLYNKPSTSAEEKESVTSLTVDESISLTEYKNLEYLTFLPNESDSIYYVVNFINNSRFKDLNKLKGITVPEDYSNYCTENGVLYSGDKTVLYCYPQGLGEANIGKNVSEIGKLALYGCTGISVDPENEYFTVVDGVLYSKDMTELIFYPSAKTDKDFVIPSTVEAIRSYAFAHSSLESVVVPSSVKYINANAFSDCTELRSVRLSEGVTTIGSGAFANCGKLKNLYIPSSVVNLSCHSGSYYSSFGSSFNDSYSIRTILHGDFDAYARDWAYASGYRYRLYSPDSVEYCELVPPTKLEYKVGESLDLDGMRLIGHLFNGETVDLTNEARVEVDILEYAGEQNISVYYENSIHQFTVSVNDALASGELDGCEWKLRFDGTLLVYGDGAMPDFTNVLAPWYEYRSQIKSVVVERGITSIGAYAFFNCNVIEDVTLPLSVTRIGEGAFSGCGSLSVITLPKRLSSIDTYAFSGCKSLTALEIPKSTLEIGSKAFNNCSNLTLYVHEESYGLTYAKDNKLSYVMIAKEREVITSGEIGTLIWELDNFDRLTVKGEGAIPDYTRTETAPWYEHRKEITSVVVEEGVTSIGNYAFYNLSRVKKMTIADSVDYLGVQFIRGTGITELSVNARTISANAFGRAD